VGYHPHLALGQRRIVFDPANQRRSARRARELAFDGDDAWPVPEDVFERLDRFAVGEAVHAPARFEARAQRRERELWTDDDDSGRHVTQV
jgi:hypothetical protein